MDIVRIQREVLNASQQFAYAELYKTDNGELYVKTVLQPSSQMYIVGIYFTDDYPYRLPKVWILKPTITDYPPHRYPDGNICYMHFSKWNPGTHNLTFVIGRAAKWLSKYEIWKRTRSWPGASYPH